MKEKAICIKCGGWKEFSLSICKSCGFEPKSDIEICKSRMLDTPWNFPIEESGEILEIGKTPKELAAIQRSIKEGLNYNFNESELQLLLKGYRELKSGDALSILKGAIIWLAPPLCFLIVLVILVKINA